MKFEPLSIPDVIYIQPDIYPDDRGYLFESFQKKIYAQNNINVDFVQDNQSDSKKGTLRGLHYQLNPFAQAKLVRVLVGEIFDVAVDIRKNSPTFGKWVGKILNSERNDALFIPTGFAHGFYVLSDMAKVFYKCSDYYEPTSARGICWNDPQININWPIHKSIKVALSPKDKSAPKLIDAELS